MKKRILLLLLTFTISFITNVDITKAANVQKLTCIYDRKYDNHGQIVQPGIKLIQYSDEEDYGNAAAKLYIAPNNAIDISSPETNWIWLNYRKVGYSIYDEKDKSNKSYLFTKCPDYIKLNDNGTIKYETKWNKDYARLLDSQVDKADNKSSYEIVGKINNEFKIYEKPKTEEEILKDEWITKCVYNGTDSKIEIYFSTQNFVIYENNINVTSGFKTSHMTISNAITLKDLLNQYDTHYGKNRCFEEVYKIENCTGKTPTGTKCTRKYNYDKEDTAQLQRKYTRVDSESVYKNTTSNPIDPDDKKNFKSCEELIGTDAMKLINEIMKWIRIIVPIILIVFGILDFSKAVFSSKEEDIKKTRETFFKRILAAILVFLAPIFVELILNLANQVWDVINPDTCIR